MAGESSRGVVVVRSIEKDEKKASARITEVVLAATKPEGNVENVI